MTKSTRKSKARKGVGLPPKPYEGFPLSPHRSGMWQKKINGKLHYFGRWGRRVDGQLQQLPGDEWWRPALEQYQRERDDLYAGRTPRPADDEALTVKALGDRFLTAKKRRVLSGELSPRTFEEYRQTAQRLADQFGKDRRVDDLDASDFEKLRATIAEAWGPVRLGNEITRVKSVFKYAFDNGLIEKPIRYGGEFRKPGKGVMRRHRAAGGKRLFEAAEIHTILDALDGKPVKRAGVDGKAKKVKLKANPALRAMVLLGVNCGFGNTDVADLQRAALDLDGGWVDFPRPKTGIERRCPLWPETVAALKAAIAARPEPKYEEDADCVFLTARRERFVRLTELSRTDAVAVKSRETLRQLGINGRKGLGFYTLRHVFRTIADGCRDQVAVDTVMGHADHTMGAVYREHVEDARLRAVADHVRAWLFPPSKADSDAPAAPAAR